MIAQTRVDPEAHGDQFDAGLLVGRAWLWNSETDEIVCGADFGSIGSEVVSTSWTEGSDQKTQDLMREVSLNADLHREAARDALGRLRAVQPGAE